MQHKASKRKSEAKDHLHCKFCGIDFQTVLAEELHVRQVRGRSKPTLMVL